MSWNPELYHEDFDIETKPCKYGNRRCCLCERMLARDQNYLCDRCKDKE